MNGTVYCTKEYELDVIWGGRRAKFTAKAGISGLGQGPYFSMTGEMRVGHRIEACGMMHDEIAKYLPDLEKYLRWHLFNVNRGPMHYLANSLFWMQERNWDNFCSTACLVEGEEVYKKIFAAFEDGQWESVKQMLLGRLEGYLFDDFDSDMKELFGDGYTFKKALD